MTTNNEGYIGIHNTDGSELFIAKSSVYLTTDNQNVHYLKNVYTDCILCQLDNLSYSQILTQLYGGK